MSDIENDLPEQAPLPYAVPHQKKESEWRQTGVVAGIAVVLATVGYVLPPIPAFGVLYVIGAVAIGARWPQRPYVLSVVFLNVATITAAGLSITFGDMEDDPIRMVVIGAIASLIFGLLGFVGVAVRLIWKKRQR